mmetsp:Transcript_46802/g.138292  ORF Transcript_46802/g.138292 Transcript_46802/m.138292 type:complete len:386 (+) Transcript_46802:3-1160(+)
MPSRDLADSSGSDDEEFKERKDEYGEPFEDYGFLERAEEHKVAGNKHFKLERYEKAMKEYDGALDQLLVVAYDKSIIVGKKKWNDVIVFRSTLHLNKSTCYFKMRDWRQAAAEATECITGNVRDEMMFADPHIRKKVKDAEKQTGACGVTLVEQRLPRTTRAKAWFRLSKCYVNLEHVEKAKEACAKALEMADDQATLAELSQHSLKIDALEKQQHQRQKRQFRGFWDRLQDRGGYVDPQAQRRAVWDSLSYEEKLRRVEELDDSDGDDNTLPMYHAQAAEEAGLGEGRGEGQRPEGAAPKDLDVPAGPYRAGDIAGSRGEEAQQRERLWRQNYWQTGAADAEEDEELRKARERLRQRKFLQEGAAVRTKLQALEDSSDGEKEAR